MVSIMTRSFGISYWLTNVKPSDQFKHVDFVWLSAKTRRKAYLSYGFWTLAQVYGMSAAQEWWKASTYAQKVEFIEEHKKAIYEEACQEYEDD